MKEGSTWTPYIRESASMCGCVRRAACAFVRSSVTMERAPCACPYGAEPCECACACCTYMCVEWGGVLTAHSTREVTASPLPSARTYILHRRRFSRRLPRCVCIEFAAKNDFCSYASDIRKLCVFLLVCMLGFGPCGFVKKIVARGKSAIR